MLVCTIFTQILSRMTNFLPGIKEGKITKKMFLNVLIPASVFFASGVVLGNSAYTYISVGYIQMIKAITPVPLLILYCLRGRESLSIVQFAIVLVISIGVMVASIGELRFSWIGFLLQISAVFSDCLRVCATDSFMKDTSIDSLSILFYTAPISFVLVSIGFCIVELSTFNLNNFTPSFTVILFLNGILAFSVNVRYFLFYINCTDILF
jgi:hypothetical protein